MPPHRPAATSPRRRDLDDPLAGWSPVGSAGSQPARTADAYLGSTRRGHRNREDPAAKFIGPQAT
jgi:hypothetical protein